MLSCLRGWSPRRVGWRLKVLQHVWKVRLVWFCQFHFLNFKWGVESHHSSLSSHVYLVRQVKLGKCGRRVLQSGIRAWFTPWTGWVVCQTWIHISCICVPHACGVCAYCVCIVLVMVSFISPCENNGVVVGCVFRECTLVTCYREYCLCRIANPTKGGNNLRNKQNKATFVFLYD